MKNALFSLRQTLLLLLATTLMGACCSSKSESKKIEFPEPPRAEGQKSVLGLRVDPIDTVRIAFIGVGSRGQGAITRFINLEGVKIVAICDLREDRIQQTQEFLLKSGWPEAAAYCGPEAWKEVCERDDIDLVYCCTDWVMHTPIGVYAMEHGKHFATEVPASLTIDECWQLVNTAEKTQRHCMMLENCCYDFFEMATLNMAQQGLFGEIVHVEGAYIHDLRGHNFNESPTGYNNMWRLKYNTEHTGNAYPTHGLGPVCQILNIHRGDRMEYLVSVSTDQFGMTEAAINKFGADSDYAKREYKMGDMNTTIIRTAKGKTIMIQHDVTSPRPYSRLHTISGTKGFAQKYPTPGIALEPDAHQFLTEEALTKLLAEYEHPLAKEIGEKARQVGGHGGMDFIMDYRLIYCLRNGLPLDQDVYDAAEWSSIVELSETSVNNNGMPVKIPDFTRGEWDKIKGFSMATVK